MEKADSKAIARPYCKHKIHYITFGRLFPSVPKVLWGFFRSANDKGPSDVGANAHSWPHGSICVLFLFCLRTFISAHRLH